jgi:nucleoside-diphosphate-sugar epimerase
MKVVVTGGAGFIGGTLARRLAKLEAVDELVLFDHVPGTGPGTCLVGDIADRGTVHALVDGDDVAVFHLAAMVSGECERDLAGAWRVNVEGTRNVLEACGARGSAPRVVFASSVAVFGGAAMPATVGDATKQTPQTTYGITKAVGELLVNDYARKGLVDGRTARLPTVIVRPGAPNAAASSFASAVFREPLAGRPYELPVQLDVTMPVIGIATLVECLVRLLGVDGAELGDDRAVNLPSISVSAGDMVESLRRVCGDRDLPPIDVRPDPFVERICRTWPQASSYERASGLGLPRDESLDAIVRAYAA